MHDPNELAQFSRRGFLKLGAGGSLVLAAAGASALLTGCSSAIYTARGYRYLRDADVWLLRALLPALLAGSLAGEAQLVATLHRFDGMCGRLEPPGQKALWQLFDLLNGAVTRRLLAGVAKPWSEVNPQEAEAFLQRWKNSGVSLFNAAWRILAKLASVAYFSLPEAAAKAGYPGPLGYVYEAANAP